MNNEAWKPIVGYENTYEVSNLGRVRSLRRNLIMKPQLVGAGYSKVTLCGAMLQYKAAYVHRLVAQAFMTNPENKPEVNHKNGVKTDNRERNLEWATQSENKKHAYATKLRVPKMPNFKGQDCYNSRLGNGDVIAIRLRYELGETNQRQLAREFDIHPVTMWAIIHRRTWKHI